MKRFLLWLNVILWLGVATGPAWSAAVANYGLVSTLSNADRIPVSVSPFTSGTTKNINWQSLKNLTSQGINWQSLSDVATLNNSDKFPINDAGTYKSVNWQTIQALTASSGGNWSDISGILSPTTRSDSVAVGTTTGAASINILKQSTKPYFKISSTSEAGDIFVIDSGGNVGIGSATPQNGVDFGAKNIFANSGTFGAASVGTVSATSTLYFSADGGVTHHVTIDNAGDLTVGSGTLTNTSGESDLYVTGNLEVGGTIYGDGSGITNITSSQWTTTGSDIYYTTGNVGVGTNAPTEALTVVGDTHSTGKFISDSTDPTNFSTNVGVGTAAPREKLEVVGDIRTSGVFKAAGNVGISTTAPANGCKCAQYTGGLCTTVGVCD